MLQRPVCYSQGWVSFYLIDLLPIIVSLQVIQAVFFGICVLTDLSSLLTRGSGNQEQERQLKKLISLRDWMLAVLAFPVGVVSMMEIAFNHKRNGSYIRLLKGKTGLIIGFCTGAAIAKQHRLSGLNNRNLVFPISRGCKSDIQVSAGLISPEVSLLGLQTASFACIFT